MFVSVKQRNNLQNFRTTSDEKISNEIFFLTNNKEESKWILYIKGI